MPDVSPIIYEFGKAILGIVVLSSIWLSIHLTYRRYRCRWSKHPSQWNPHIPRCGGCCASFCQQLDSQADGDHSYDTYYDSYSDTQEQADAITRI